MKMLGMRVEYPIDAVNFGVGNVVEYDEGRNLAVVVDEDDGHTFRGPADKLTPL
ncbi:hypothetical protein N5D73_25765 [Aeromonas caviae]|uniref:Uncharacterized protein n=1 Tax=Aeromonas caviae TaxID=648 RepID=A0AA42RF66_AERCA|nr:MULTISPECIES: hypothetical protein [Aeromonas]MCR3973648.1 hypothetical protein [Aeromonas veronii]MCR3977857.1 hypothetical protein [Aeromonas veronii]MDH1507602.1 hypothetical protein [Aeromonas caviae]MDH1807347.1 hypothetical protein [Aeromonas caviae]MDH1850879.1 hypothetical protein [Aeromonas caviae]